MLKEMIEKLMLRQHLTYQESALSIQEMVQCGNAPQIAAFLTLMRSKGETVDELYGVITAMRQLMRSLKVPGPLLDIVGTGGDGAHTVNISTGAAILTASCGVKVAKHGNRSVSSRCGSADVLESLGINIQMAPEKIAECLNTIGIGFMFAPCFHPAMHVLKEVRGQLRVRTIFNLIGPLLNPAAAEHLMIGVCNEKLVELIAEVLFRLGTRKSLVFHGNGLDELSCIGPAKAIEVTQEGMKAIEINPKKLGFSACKSEDLCGGDAAYNANLLMRAFGKENSLIKDTLVLNAAVAMQIYGAAETVEEGIAKANEAIKNNCPLQLLKEWRQYG